MSRKHRSLPAITSSPMSFAIFISTTTAQNFTASWKRLCLTGKSESTSWSWRWFEYALRAALVCSRRAGKR